MMRSKTEAKEREIPIAESNRGGIKDDKELKDKHEEGSVISFSQVSRKSMIWFFIVMEKIYQLDENTASSKSSKC